MNLPNHVVILGLARQGMALARFFAGRDVAVTLSDGRTADALRAEMDALAECGDRIRYVLGEHPLSLLDDCDLLCLSGGVPLELPVVAEAVRRGIPLSNDAQEFLARCPAPVIGITGSAGKTTTTTLVGRMLDAAGFTTWVGGNIGNPLIGDLDSIGPDDRVVMELSSFQLDLMRVSPQIAGVLNVTPNHLDRHKTMAAYIAAKRHIVAHQRAGDVAVLGFDDANARKMTQATPAEVRYFSGRVEVTRGAFWRGGALVLRRGGQEREVCRVADVRLRGFHNVRNVLAAITLADAADAPIEAMREAIVNFTGVAHRLEEVRRWRGALWINDSIATAPERVLAALDAFEEPLVLLAGGRDKDLPWADFARRVVERVRVVIAFGEAGSLIAEHLRRALAEAGDAVVLAELVPVTTLAEAVDAAAQRVQPGDVVLLSPGGTSYDAYRDFAERGEQFRALVQALSDQEGL